MNLEEHFKNVIEGGPLEGFYDACAVHGGIWNAVLDLYVGFVDRNQTAPVPSFCGQSSGISPECDLPADRARHCCDRGHVDDLQHDGSEE